MALNRQSVAIPPRSAVALRYPTTDRTVEVAVSTSAVTNVYVFPASTFPFYQQSGIADDHLHASTNKALHHFRVEIDAFQNPDWVLVVENRGKAPTIGLVVTRFARGDGFESFPHLTDIVARTKGNERQAR